MLLSRMNCHAEGTEYLNLETPIVSVSVEKQHIQLSFKKDHLAVIGRRMKEVKCAKCLQSVARFVDGNGLVT